MVNNFVPPNGQDFARDQAHLARHGRFADGSVVENFGGRSMVRADRRDTPKVARSPREQLAAVKNAIAGLADMGRHLNLELDVNRVRTVVANIEKLTAHYDTDHKNPRIEEKKAELEALRDAFSVAAAAALTRHVVAIYVKPAGKRAALGNFSPISVPEHTQTLLSEIHAAIRPSDVTESFKQRLSGLATAIPTGVK